MNSDLLACAAPGNAAARGFSPTLDCNNVAPARTCLPTPPPAYHTTALPPLHLSPLITHALSPPRPPPQLNSDDPNAVAYATTSGQVNAAYVSFPTSRVFYKVGGPGGLNGRR